MSKLYPIGTILTTSRLSQAALYCDIFEKNNLESSEILAEIFLYGNVEFLVTTENQAYLSPVPMDGDLVTRSDNGNREPFPQFWNSKLIFTDGDVIEKRTYPNGMRAPLIEWDEVSEPQG